ncbi:MAG: hypothetical protein ACPGJV_01160 [Bacteriovoracaceae bacterium]
MKINVEPKSNYLASNPIYFTITKSSGKPKAEVVGMGDIPVELKSSGEYVSFVWFQREGDYKVRISDTSTTQSFELKVAPAPEVSFSLEFGVFMALFSVCFIGVLLWNKKMKSKQLLEQKLEKIGS